MKAIKAFALRPASPMQGCSAAIAKPDEKAGEKERAAARSKREERKRITFEGVADAIDNPSFCR
ncbi:hypothetical protein [Labrys neptuniae]|uniref:hypothetical protein n=1 Tax=Labrys neptuniae TaxID=376174 RepID=UPI00289E141E|nr:hypothetical protein [Labrys neptuniae]